MSEISKAYEPQSVEDKWYDFWLKQGCFTADPARVSDQRPAYSIVIPPPNVTGMLHMGHVLNNTIQDILSRKARMDGKEVLWLPGTDHAGIATQVQVEKALKKEERKTKYDLGREEFLKRVWAWKEEKGGIIINQLKKLGCSCDWTRERFTMDPEYSRCVQRVFVELYKKGLIYRGKRMVNWCPATQTALSDEEVEMKPQKGFMYHFKVQVAEVVGQASSLSGGPSNTSAPQGRQDACPTTEIRLTDTWLTIATTRPETIPGDTAVAVNPKDTRYAHLIGKHIVRPLPAELPREQKLIPIIGDEHVDFEFGTGVLKVTPAHDKADFEIGQRHKLAIVEVINADGSMNNLAGQRLAGLDRFKARKVAEELLTEQGVLVEAKPYENNVGFSQRADVPIEPRLSEQWFLKYPAVEQSKACVEQISLLEKTVSVATATGMELPGASIKELRHAALAYARSHGFLGQPFKNHDSGLEIRVGRQGLSHAFSNLGVANIKAVAVLPELIQKAIWLSTEPHEPKNPLIKQVHRFVAALALGGELHSVFITAKEYYDGTVHYDHKAKKIAFGGKSLEAHPREGKLDTQPAPNAGVKVRDLLEDVNRGARMKFHPDRWAKVYDHWLANIQDWCISRQLWWGHRIPVWYSEGWTKLGRVLVMVKLRGNELPGTNVKALRRSAFAFAKSHGIIGQDFLNLDTQQLITVHKSSLEHGFSNFGVANVKLVPALPDLLRHAVRVSVEPHVPASNDVKAVETYLAMLRLGDQFFRVKFRVKVFAPNFRLYDHQVVLLCREKENEPDGNKSPEAVVPKDGTSRPASGSRVTLGDLIPNVNADPAFTRCQAESPGLGWTQDPDVLDTWFSSWLWPFATMGWPENTETLKKFYPTTDLVTGPDIIFFWVARMIMAGYEYMGELPFKNVYFTGIIRDKQGRKMSKTLGNSPDPLVLIAQYGADALRFGTMRSAPLGQDVLFDEKDVELGRNFCNKLWNACRFRQMQGSGTGAPPVQNDGQSASSDSNRTGRMPVPLPEGSAAAFEAEINPSLLTSDDKWILLRLDQAIHEVSDALAAYNFSTAVQSLYRFFWSEYCDWYVEASKAAFFGEDAKLKANKLAVIDFVLGHTLRLFHPFLPFITEELWHGMGFSKDLPEKQGGKTIMFAPWPKPFGAEEKDYFGLNDEADQVAQAKYDLVSLGRGLRRDSKIDPAKKVKFVLRPNGSLPAPEIEVLRLLLNAESVELVGPDWSPERGTPVCSNSLGELFLPLAGLVDLAAERARLEKELAKVDAEIDKAKSKLANPHFAQKVPPAVLREHQDRLAHWEQRRAQIQSSLDLLR